MCVCWVDLEYSSSEGMHSIKRNLVVPPHKVEHRSEIDGGQGGVGKVFRGDGGREEDEQAKIGARSPRASQGLLKFVDKGRNLFHRRKKCHDTNAIPFRRRCGHNVPWQNVSSIE